LAAGTAEQWIKEVKQAVKMTRLSCHRFRSNGVRLWLSVIAYNLATPWRQLVLPKRVDPRSPTSLRRRLVKTGGRLEKQAQWLEREYPSATASLREGLAEMFTVNCLGLSPSLTRCLVSTTSLQVPTAVCE
jgi:hypothetical protein